MTRRAAGSLAAALCVALAVTAAMPLLARAQAVPPPATSGAGIALGLPRRCPGQARQILTLNTRERRVVGRWITVEGPSFDVPPGQPQREIVAHAIRPSDPRHMLATDGVRIARTRDAGCRWETVHTLAPVLPGPVDTADLAQIVDLALAANGTAYALVLPADGPGRPSVLVSEDGGTTWVERSQGLPPVTIATRTEVCPCVRRAGIIAVAPSAPTTAYVALTPANVAHAVVYATTTAGGTWTPRPPRTSAAAISQGIEELVVDPVTDSVVWALADGLIHRSPGPGQMWEVVDPDGAAVDSTYAGLVLWRAGGRSPRVRVLARPASPDGLPFRTLHTSLDGGSEFSATAVSIPLLGDPEMALGATDGEMLVVARNGTHVVDTRSGRAEPVENLELPGTPTEPQTDSTSVRTVWFRTGRHLAAYLHGPPPGRQWALPAPVPPVGPPPVVAALTPGAVRLELPAEGEATVDYDLAVPASPSPVDVWFLVDTSGSMGGAIEGLRRGFTNIVTALREAGLDARYGLAEYKGADTDGSPVHYRRVVDLSPPGGALERGLRTLRAEGGGEETQYTALYQTVTGEGQPEVNIPPGQQATFRPDALRIVVHATDEPFGYVPEAPSRDDAVDALVGARVRHIGLDLSSGGTTLSLQVPPRPTPNASARADLDDLARATQTFAPDEGVDCNDDGTVDVKGGAPLTCPVNRNRDTVEIAPAIISAVRAVRDETIVGVGVIDGAGLEIAVDEPARAVNLKEPTNHRFPVTYRCPTALTGRTVTATIAGTVRGVSAATARATVVCGVAPVRPAAPSRPHPAVAPPVPAPPQVVPQLEHGLSPTNNPSPVPGAVAQPAPVGALATQPVEAEVAYATSGGRDEDGGLGPAGTAAAGAMALGLGGLAMRRGQASASSRTRRDR